MTIIIRPTTYASYRTVAESGDVLLCRPTTPQGRLIVDITHTTYSHASLVGWLNPHRRDDPTASALLIAESVGHGKRLIPLSGEVQRYSGVYDVWRVRDRYPRLFNHVYDGEATFAFAARGANSGYGWSFIWRILCRRYLPWPFNRVAAAPNSNDPTFRRDCSGQVHAALRLNCGPNLREFDSDVTPGDLADKAWFEYFFTLYATLAEVDAVNAALDARRQCEAAAAEAIYGKGLADDCQEDDNDAA